MNKTRFKKSYGDSLKNGYSKEYMDAYMSWRRTLTKKQLASIENCNDKTTTPSQFRKKNKQMRKKSIMWLKNRKLCGSI